MSEWITDRRPINDDEEYVFNQFGDMVHYLDIKQGEPWMRIERPEPYVNKPKRYTVKWLTIDACWAVMEMHYVATRLTKLNCECDEHREAAERIAAIYDEVVP